MKIHESSDDAFWYSQEFPDTVLAAYPSLLYGRLDRLTKDFPIKQKTAERIPGESIPAVSNEPSRNMRL